MANSLYIRNKLATAYKTEALWVSFHFGDPGDDGGDEFAYDRQAATWAGPTTGRITASVTQDFTPGDVLVALGFWTDETGGDFVDSVAYEMEYPSGGSDTFDLGYEYPA